MVPSLFLLSCESSVSVKENPYRKKNSFIFDQVASANDICKNGQKFEPFPHSQPSRDSLPASQSYRWASEMNQIPHAPHKYA